MNEIIAPGLNNRPILYLNSLGQTKLIICFSDPAAQNLQLLDNLWVWPWQNSMRKLESLNSLSATTMAASWLTPLLNFNHMNSRAILENVLGG